MKNRTLFVFNMLLALGFGLNYIWENLHSVLYKDYENFAQSLFLPLLIYASIIDAFIVFLIYSIIALIRLNLLWVEKIQWRDFVLSAIFGVLIAAVIELRALNMGKWSYNELMPVIPGLKVGVFPLLQMTLLPVFTFTLINKIIVWKLTKSSSQS